MLTEFDSKRIDVINTENQDNFSHENIVELLTIDATQYLPPDWKDVNTAQQAQRWLEQRCSEGSVYSLYLKAEKDTFIGLLFLSDLIEQGTSTEVRLGYIIAEKYWGLGLASELISLVVATLKEHDHVSAIVGGVSSDNLASIRVLTKNGFTLHESTAGSDFYIHKFQKI